MLVKIFSARLSPSSVPFKPVLLASLEADLMFPSTASRPSTMSEIAWSRSASKLGLTSRAASIPLAIAG
jgi:hypothetical protein